MSDPAAAWPPPVPAPDPAGIRARWFGIAALASAGIIPLVAVWTLVITGQRADVFASTVLLIAPGNLICLGGFVLAQVFGRSALRAPEGRILGASAMTIATLSLFAAVVALFLGVSGAG